MRGGAIFDRMVEAHQGAPKRILNNVKQQLRQTSGRGASQGKRKSQCRHSEMVSSLVCRRSEMVSSLLCFCTKMKSSEVQCGKRKWEKRPGRLEYVKTYEIWLFHGQQRSWKCIVQTNGSATLYILHSPDQCFPSYTMQDISYHLQTGCFAGWTTTIPRGWWRDSTTDWFPPCHLLAFIISWVARSLQYTESSKRLRE